MKQLILEVIIKPVEEKKFIMSSLHELTKEKPCMTNLITFCDGVTGSVDERRAADVVYLDFSKAFGTVSHNFLLGNLRNCGREERTVRWIEN